MAGQRQDGRSRTLRAHIFSCDHRTRECSGSRVSLCLSKLVPDNSDTPTLPPARLHFLNLPNWGPSVQILEPVRDVLT